MHYSRQIVFDVFHCNFFTAFHYKIHRVSIICPEEVKRFYFYCSVLVEPEEIKRLGKRFRKLDLDQSGSLSVEEFMSLPELQQNPLVQRVIEIFDQDGNGEVDFKGWSPENNCNAMHTLVDLP
jgi:hypothetical protein